MRARSHSSAQNRSHIRQLTAAGRGAVAVLEICNARPEDAALIDQYFQAANGQRASEADVNRILYGHWEAEDVVVVRTSPQCWEVSCHGGVAAVAKITNDVQSRLAGPTEDAINQPPNRPTIAELLMQELLKCRTIQTARYVLAQQQGVFEGFLRELSTNADDVEVLDQIREFLRWRRFAEHLTLPWQVAIAGQPNAGKSSLLNAIAGFERSIVFEQPGTTRDRVEADLTFDCWPFRLIDTAGIRVNSNDAIERRGVESAREILASCDACLLVVDATVGWTNVEDSLLQTIPTHCPVAVLWNKCDLATNVNCDSLPDRATLFRTSAVTRSGLSQTTAWLVETLVPKSPAFDQPLPVLPIFSDRMSSASAAAIRVRATSLIQP